MTGLTKRPSGGLRNVLGLRVLVSLGVEHGLSAPYCLTGTGVREARLDDPSATVTVEQELQVIRNLLARLQSVPGLGAIAGTKYHANAFGPLGLALSSSATGRDALAVALRFFNLTFALTRFEAVDAGDLTVVTIDDSLLPVNLRRFLVERDASALMTVRNDLFVAQPLLASVAFTFPAPLQSGPYVQVFGQLPQFSAKRNMMCLRREMLIQALPQANALLFKTAERQCQLLLERQQGTGRVTELVRELLMANVAEFMNMESAAKSLQMTPRTLRRRLLLEGSTFLELRDEVRLFLAQEYLSTTAMSVDEVSMKLNYASATSFIAAFKRWKGVTPLVYKKAAMANPRRHASDLAAAYDTVADGPLSEPLAPTRRRPASH